jgi:hypothetical protein
MDREFWRKKAVERGTEILNLKNKLDIAIETLEEYADRKNWSGENKSVFKAVGFQEAAQALFDIKELNK